MGICDLRGRASAPEALIKTPARRQVSVVGDPDVIADETML